MDLFILQHAHIINDDEEAVKLIGVYSTRERAQAAIERLKMQPGFRDTPQGFSVDLYTLDEDHWTEGFITLLGPGNA